jgi:2-polyprenyl-6-hydroxyphenyl methylase/3-demethylubiquinone-9 3-methyltransferase
MFSGIQGGRFLGCCCGQSGQKNKGKKNPGYMIMNKVFMGYRYTNAEASPAHEYLLPTITNILNSEPGRRRIFEIGCGNGSVANELAAMGFDVTGIEPSCDGIAYAKSAYPSLNIFSGSAYDDLADQYGKYPIVISLEVVEHLYYPRKFATTIYDLLEPGGLAIISTPFHGYWKNLALSLTGKMDDHFTALWDGGHIKFWSMSTLSILLREAGLADISFLRVGRIPALAKSMIAIARKPPA